MNRNLVFLAKFFAIFAFLHILLFVPNLSVLQDGIAGFEANALGLDYAGNEIFFNGNTFVIVPSCTGLVSSIVLAAIIFSLKKPRIGKKIVVFIAGSAALMLLNLARVYIVLWAGITLGSAMAEIAHIASWFLVAAAIIFLWYKLTKRICKVDNFEDFL